MSRFDENDDSFQDHEFYGQGLGNNDDDIVRDEDGEDNEDDDYDRISNDSEMDEQHTQKVNGQIENLQFKVEELSQALVNERRNVAELTARRAIDESIFKENIQASQKIIEELKQQLNHYSTTDQGNVLPDAFAAELRRYCLRFSLPYDSVQEITSEIFSNILYSICSKVNIGNINSQGSLRSMTSSSSASTFGHSNSQPSAYLQSEFMKLCSKLSLSVNDSNTSDNVSVLHDDKCVHILHRVSKIVHENNIKVKHLEAEVRMSMNASEDIRALKTKLIQLVERLRLEKEHKIKAENDAAAMKKKVEMISEHVEKLMAHLKHEANSKLRIADQLRTSEREFNQVKETCEAIQRKSAAKDRLIIELREGSKILEDQLRLMDEKYLELRSKLDWTREIGAAKLKKAEKKAADLRVKYAMTTNSSAVLDHIPLPDIYGSRGALPDGSMNIFPDRYSTVSSSLGSRRTNRSISRNGRLLKNGILSQDVSKMNSIIGEEPSMEHVMEKLRIQENKKREWTEEKVRKLIQTK